MKALEPQCKKITHIAQNGFVAGRNFLNNILDLDSAGRIFSMVFESECNSSNPSNIPIIGAFDFEAAFPSVIHGWIWLVLKHRKLPEHFIKLFQGIYHAASAMITFGLSKIKIIDFLSGVLQGCPGSAFLFNNALDPFLWKIHCVIREANKGIARGCADDLGICLSRLKHLNVLAPIFQDAFKFAGLKLKPPKCVIVPLCQLSEKRKIDIAKWLRRNIPEWQHFSIQGCTKLLGFYIGPQAGRFNWTEQASKMKIRVQSIQLAEASIKLNAHTFNTRVVPVASYIAQLLPIPDRFMQIERALLHTVLRLPQNALCHADFFHIHEIGGPSLRSFNAASVAALMRSAIRTIPGWKFWITQLADAAQNFLPLELFVRDYLSTSAWDSPPIAVNLREAFNGLPNHPHWSLGNSDILSKLHCSELGKQCVQKQIYKELISRKFGNKINNTSEKRLTTLFHPYELDFQKSILLPECWCILRKCRVSDAVKVIKGWCNGWATSRRYHEDILLPCLFGCYSCQDDMSHYLCCPHLFALWSFLALPVSCDPLVRWGLIAPNHNCILQIACAFSGYHAVRSKFKCSREVFHNNQHILSGPQIRTAWTVFAETFLVEAREVSLSCRNFSVPSFLDFLSEEDSSASFFIQEPFEVGCTGLPGSNCGQATK